MYIPDYLLYEPKQFKENLTTEFTGNLDVAKALQANPRCWKKQNIAGTKQKKTIVINDFRLAGMDEKKIEETKHNIDKLILEGFTVYLWQEQGPIELNQNNTGMMFLPLVRNDCSPQHPLEITKMMASKNVPAEGLILMDVNALDHLQNEIQREKELKQTQSNEVDIRDIAKSNFSFNAIHKAIPEIKVIAPALDNSILPLLEDWHNKSNIPVHFSYQDYLIDTKDKASFYFSIAEKVKNLNIRTLQGLSLKELLDKGVNLETVKVSDKNFFENLDIEDSGSYQSIRVLDLSDGFNNENAFDKFHLLMIKMPNLKKIIIPEPFIDQVEYIKKNGPPIEVLQKMSPEERQASLQQLDKELGQLKAIEHLICKPKTTPGRTDFTLSLTRDTPVSENLAKLQSTTNLESLKIAVKPQTTTNMPSDENILKQHTNKNLAVLNLEIINETKPIEHELSRYYTVYNTVHQDITPLSNFAPHLHELKLVINPNCQISTQVHMPPIHSLRAIRVEAKSTHTLKFLNELAPNLESLELKGDQLQYDDILTGECRKLRSLSISNDISFSSGFTLSALFNKYPKLENVEINGEKILSIFQNTDNLPKNINLKTLTFSFPSYEVPDNNCAVQIAEIVKRSRNLTELNLKKCKCCSEIIKTLSNSGAKLNHLRKVNFTASNFTFEDYLLLRQMAPNLESIDITNCPASKKEDDLKNDKLLNIINRESKINYLNKEKAASAKSSKQIGKGENKKNRSINSDVLNKDIEYDLTEIFTDIHGGISPPVNHYRLSTFDTIQFTPSPAHPYELQNEGDLDLKPYKTFQYGAKPLADRIQSARQEKKPLFHGKHKMWLSHTFAPLPSLAPNEVLHALNISGLKQTDIEVKYSSRDNLYYIRRKKAGFSEVDIDFLVETPPSIESKNERLQEFAESFNSFGIAKDNINMEGLSPEEKLKLLYDSKVGRCELRAIMFKHFAKVKFPDLPVRIISNDCHAFVEVLENNQWIKYDLGGYPAKLNVKKQDSDLNNTTAVETSALVQKSPDDATLTRTETVIEKHNLEDAQGELVEFDFELDDIEALDSSHVTWGAQDTVKLEPDPFLLSALSATKVDIATNERHGQNVLVKCESDEDVQTTCLNLQHMAKHTGRPVFVINNPEELVCASKWLRREKDNTGTPMAGPGGPLHEFLTTMHPKGTHPALIVNWNNFSADELVRYNTLIDENRIADKTPLPKDMVVVGLYNTKKPNAYTGSDFYSRHSKKSIVTPNTLPSERFALQVPERNAMPNAVEIELYDSINWKEILLGQWVMEAGKIRFNEGPLTKALEKGQAVHLRNAPWHIPEFQQFWQEAKIHGIIQTTGKTVDLPSSFWERINQSRGYEWKKLLTSHHFEQNTEKLKNPFVINPGTFNQFIDHYDIQNKLPQFTKSVFSKYENTELDVMLTATLNAPSWDQLLKEAKRYNIKLNIGVPEGISIPESLEKDYPVLRLKHKMQSVPEASLIVSTDVSMSTENLKSTLAKDNPLVIDVSEFDNGDIFYSNKAKLEENENSITFETKISDVWNQLQNNQTVILKGHFKEELSNACMEICLRGGLTINGKFEPLKGKLILLSDTPLSMAVDSKYDAPSLQEKLDSILIKTKYTDELQRAIKTHPWPKDATFAQIEAAIKQYQRTNPPDFDIQEGILKIGSRDPHTQQSIDFSDEAINKACDTFIATRLNDLKNILADEPFAFIGGKTGVGKSTFMKRYITSENGFKLYNEMHELENWANDKTKGKSKVLFIDEANISDKDYTLFEGLYEIPPRLLINGKLLTLTPEHKVVLAGNPMSYGGERHLPTLLAQHGNACTFDIMPVEFIYRDILKPVFDARGLQIEKAKEFSECILSAYQHICAISQDEILISPRELKMMAMMVVSSPESNSNFQNIVYEVALQCLPNENKDEFQQLFLSQFPNCLSSTKQPIPLKSVSGKTFTLTPSRVPIYNSLERLLAVRETMLTSKDAALKTSGLGGMILEGEPGTGKSHFLIDALMKHGYHPHPPKTGTDKVFYVIPTSLSFEDKERLLIDAFEKGSPVVIDEINSTPMMEQLLNSLLMGEHPVTKKPAARPGFLLLATQNPISMAGRQATSQAIKRRVLFHEFKSYNGAEMQDILTDRFENVPLTRIQTEVRHHLNAVRYAKKHHLDPAPVFRDLYKIVEKIDECIPRAVIKRKPEEAARALKPQTDNAYRAPKVTHGLHMSKDKLRSKPQIQDENTPPNANLSSPKIKMQYDKLLKGIKDKDTEVFQLLLFYVQQGDIEAVNEYLKASKNTGWGGTDFPESLSKAHDGGGNSALHMIAKSGNMDLWNIVANSGYWDKTGWYDPMYIFDFTLKNNQSETPLDVAIKAGNVEIVKGMMDVYRKGANYARNEHQAYLKHFEPIDSNFKKLLDEVQVNHRGLKEKSKKQKRNL